MNIYSKDIYIKGIYIRVLFIKNTCSVKDAYIKSIYSIGTIKYLEIYQQLFQILEIRLLYIG